MNKSAPRQRRQRGSIDPEEILEGAFAVAERVGLDNLSMPELASHLDVGVTSIYWYYRNKEDLLRRMSSRAVTQLQDHMVTPENRSPDEWKAFLREFFTTERQFHSEADLITDLTLMRTAVYSRKSTLVVYQSIENAIAYLLTAGFTLNTAWYLYSTCSIYTRGFVMTERNRRENQTPPAGKLQLNLLDPQSMPLLSQLIIEEPIFIDMTGDKSFEFGLEILLEEAERLLKRDQDGVPQV